MSLQYIRKCRITIDDTPFELYGVEDARDDQSLRVRFDIADKSLQTPRVATVRITNLGETTAKKMLGKVGKKLTIEAGYRDGINRIFQGEIKQAKEGQENPTDKYVDVYAATHERAYNYAMVSKTLPAGSSGRDIYKACLEAMKLFGVVQGNVPGILDSLKYPRPVTLFGHARDQLRTLALSRKCTWNIRDDFLDVVPTSEALPGGTIILTSRTGLIGLPAQTEMGITARCLINPKIGINSLVKIDQKSVQRASPNLSYLGEAAYNSEPYLPGIAADGLYKACGVSHIGDTRGQPWYCELILIRSGGSLNEAQNAAGLGLGFN